MTNDSPQNSESPASTLDYKEIYLGSADDQSVGAVAKECGAKVLERLTSIKPNSGASVITGKMQDAIAANDLSEILRLADCLKTMKEQEDSHIEKLVEISKEFRFDELLAAYPDEMEALAYEVAVLAIITTETAILGQKKRIRSNATTGSTSRNRKVLKDDTYVISRDGHTVEVSPNKGRPANPGVDRAFYEFMGFTVSEDGKQLTPASFVDKAGNEVKSVSKKSILEDLQAGNPYWMDKGFKMEPKASQNATAV
jgi:hypothetical protein